MPRRLPDELRDELRAMQLPLHSARIHWRRANARKPYFDRILAEEGLTQEQFKLKGFHELFFSRGERAAWCFPQDLTANTAGDKEHPGRRGADAALRAAPRQLRDAAGQVYRPGRVSRIEGRK